MLGLDLPMKVVDMFGCGMPVLARRFECINELVNENVNGMTFNDSHQLFEQTVSLLTGFPKYSQVSIDDFLYPHKHFKRSLL